MKTLRIKETRQIIFTGCEKGIKWLSLFDLSHHHEQLIGNLDMSQSYWTAGECAQLIITFPTALEGNMHSFNMQSHEMLSF